MTMTANGRRFWWRRFFEANPQLFQFGQGNDELTLNGSTACGHTSVQALILGWTGKHVTLDDICNVSGYTLEQAKAGHGLYSSQIVAALAHYGVHYNVVWNATADDLIAVVESKGPVLYASRYTQYPEWQGFTYHGIHADGRPNGYARPYGHAGKTQLNGDFGHAGILFGVRRPPKQPVSVLAHDPNHNSPGRLEKPPFDVMTRSQFARLLESFRTVPVSGGRTYAFVPKEVFDR